MRPKKKIVLIDDVEQRASIRSFVLWTRSYDVISFAATPQKRAELRRIALASAAIVNLSRGARKACAAIRALAPAAKIICIGDAVHTPLVDLWISRKEAEEMVVLLDWVGVAATRKRGPKKPPGVRRHGGSVGKRTSWKERHCSRCGAPPGRACVGLSGQKIVKPHRERLHETKGVNCNK